jgi:hypothetical protein
LRNLQKRAYLNLRRGLDVLLDYGEANQCRQILDATPVVTEGGTAMDAVLVRVNVALNLAGIN